MTEVARVGPEEARQKVEAGEAILVCAYDDEEKCRQLHLAGAIDMHELEEKLPAIPKDKELIFYCA